MLKLLAVCYLISDVIANSFSERFRSAIRAFFRWVTAMSILEVTTSLMSKQLIQARDKFLAENLRMDVSSGIIIPRTSGAAWAAAAAKQLPRARSLEEIVVGAGIDEETKSVNVYLSRDPSGLNPPPMIGDFPARYVTTGPFRAASEAQFNPRRRYRPARPGRSIGPSSKTAGTLGALVRCGGEIHMLSAGHVLTDFAKLAPPTNIYQPSLLDQEDPHGKNIIARLSRTSALDDSADAENRLDAGLAVVVNSRLVAYPFLSPIGRLRGDQYLRPRKQMMVQKIGRTTGHRTGYILDSQATVKVEFGVRIYRFVDQIVIAGKSDPFGLGGDSGAVILGCRTPRPIGLLMAASLEGWALANRFDHVQKSLGFSLLV